MDYPWGNGGSLKVGYQVNNSRSLRRPFASFTIDRLQVAVVRTTNRLHNCYNMLAFTSIPTDFMLKPSPWGSKG